MKKYISPVIRISIFDVETISATDDTTGILSTPAFGANLEAYTSGVSSVQKNLDFNKAIDFKSD